MAKTEDRLEVLAARIAGLAERRKAARAELAKQRKRRNAKNADVRAEAERIIASTEPELEEIVRTLTRAEFELKLERAMRTTKAVFDAMKGDESVALEIGGVGSEESDRAVALTLADLANVRAMENFLRGRAGELVELLRPFVLAHFRAYTRSDDPEKRYPAWFSDASLLIALLQDNPLYSLTVEQLVALVGLKQATALLKVDYAAVEKLAVEELLTSVDGQSVSLEQLAELRDRKERTPRLELKVRGDQPIEELLEVIDPVFAKTGMGIEALELDNATESALRAAGYTLVAQVRTFFDTLQNIKGIGPKRAAKIIDALVRNAAGT